jgi:hypothetical protein
MRRQMLGIALVVAAVASAAVSAPAGAARQSAYQQVLSVYESQGTIPACRFSGAELSDALSGVDTYGAQYFADFTQAVRAALSARAAGGCSSAATAAPAVQRVPGGVAQPPAHFGSVTAATSAGIPAPLAVLAVLALVGALVGAGTALARRRHAAVGQGTRPTE